MTMSISNIINQNPILSPLKNSFDNAKNKLEYLFTTTRGAMFIMKNYSFTLMNPKLDTIRISGIPIQTYEPNKIFNLPSQILAWTITTPTMLLFNVGWKWFGLDPHMNSTEYDYPTIVRTNRANGIDNERMIIDSRNVVDSLILHDKKAINALTNNVLQTRSGVGGPNSFLGLGKTMIKANFKYLNKDIQNEYLQRYRDNLSSFIQRYNVTESLGDTWNGYWLYTIVRNYRLLTFQKMYGVKYIPVFFTYNDISGHYDYFPLQYYYNEDKNRRADIVREIDKQLLSYFQRMYNPYDDSSSENGIYTVEDDIISRKLEQRKGVGLIQHLSDSAEDSVTYESNDIKLEYPNVWDDIYRRLGIGKPWKEEDKKYEDKTDVVIEMYKNNPAEFYKSEYYDRLLFEEDPESIYADVGRDLVKLRFYFPLRKKTIYLRAYFDGEFDVTYKKNIETVNYNQVPLPLYRSKPQVEMNISEIKVKLVAFNPAELAMMYKRLNEIIELISVHYDNGVPTNNVVYLTLGSVIVREPVIVEEIKFKSDKSTTWDIEVEKPMYIDVSIKVRSLQKNALIYPIKNVVNRTRIENKLLNDYYNAKKRK